MSAPSILLPRNHKAPTMMICRSRNVTPILASQGFSACLCSTTELLENEATRKALELVEKSAMTEGQLYAYEKFWLSVVDERILREAAVKKAITKDGRKAWRKVWRKVWWKDAPRKSLRMPGV